MAIDLSPGHWVHRHLLVLRFALFNIVATGLLAAVYLQGWLDGAMLGYTAWLTLGIGAVFVFGLLFCGLRIWRTNRELNAVGQDDPPRLSRVGRYLTGVAGRPAEYVVNVHMYGKVPAGVVVPVRVVVSVKAKYDNLRQILETSVELQRRNQEETAFRFRLDDSLEPRYYVLPWQQQLAEKLQNLVDEAIRDGASVTISNPFSRKSFDDLGSMNMQIVRPPQSPMKPPSPPAQIFNPRERST